MQKEFDANEPVELPEYLLSEHVDDFWIVTAPEYPNWLVLDDEEYQMFSSLRNGLTVMASMDKFFNQNELPEERVLEIMTKLLGKIEETAFYKSTPVYEEEPVESFPKLIQINLTNNCNLRCRHCYMSAGKSTEQKLPLPALIDLIDRINEINGKSEIVLSGGEPLMYEHLFELLKVLHAKGNKLTLFTNGTLINRNNFELIGKCCNEIQFSFEGLTRDCFESVRGRGIYNKVMSALELMKSTGIRITLAITILPMTSRDVEDNLVQFVSALEYDNLAVRLNHQIDLTGNARTLDMSGYDRRVYDALVMRLMKNLKALGIEISHPAERNIRFTNCGIGTNLIINFDGKIYPCSKIGCVHFDIDDDIKNIFQRFDELNRSTSNRFIKKCQACNLKYICSGGCRIDNYNASGDMLKPACDDNFKHEVYRRLIFEYLRG